MSIKDKIANSLGYSPNIIVEELKGKTENLTKDLKKVNSSYKVETKKLSTQLIKVNEDYSGLKNNFDTLLNSLQDAQRSFAASQTTNITSDWNDIYDTINSSLNKGLVCLRGRSRLLAQSDPWAKKYLFMLQKNVVGADGFILRNNAYDLVYDEVEKMKVKRFDKLANTIIQEMFDDWSLPENCDVTGQSSFRELCNIIIKQIPTDGEILIKPVRDKSYKYGYALQLIEADYLDETFSTVLPNGNMVIMGVEMTPYRKPIAYWLKKINPYQQLMY